MRWPVPTPSSSGAHFLASLPYHSGGPQGSQAAPTNSHSEESKQEGTRGAHTLDARVLPSSSPLLSSSHHLSLVTGEQGARVLSFIDQCLHVCRAPSSLIFHLSSLWACLREVKRINQKTLSQSLSCRLFALLDLPRNSHTGLHQATAF